MPNQGVLLVDDEAGLAELLKRYLERLGYRVNICTSPEAALAILDTDPTQYQLILTDLTLPMMNGEELIERARERAPHLKAIIASGYPYRPRAVDIEFLQKPFLPKTLAETIERMMHA